MYIPLSNNICLHNLSYDENPALISLGKQISKFKPLKKEEELDLFIKAKSGDNSAKDKIIYSNLRFAIAIAKKYANKSFPLEDFVSEAMLGLLEAFDSFNPKRNIKFITYAVSYIQRNLSEMQLGPIRLPHSYRVLRKSIYKNREKLEQLHCGYIPLDVLEQYMNLNHYQIRDYLYEIVSLDAWFEKYEEELL